MKLTTILLVGATALAVPAFAADNAPNQSGTAAPQVDAHANAGTDATQAQAANGVSAKAPMADASASTQTAANDSTAQPAAADTSSSAAPSGQMAMNSSMSSNGGADTAPLSSVPDTQKKYKRSARASDFSKEAETTKQLNQQVASAGGLPKTQQ